MQRSLTAVDMQNDFADGALGSKESVGTADAASSTGVTHEKHEAALETMRSYQITII